MFATTCSEVYFVCQGNVLLQACLQRDLFRTVKIIPILCFSIYERLR